MIQWFCIGFGLAFIFIGLLVKLPDYVPSANSIVFGLGILLFIVGLVCVGLKKLK